MADPDEGKTARMPPTTFRLGHCPVLRFDYVVMDTSCRCTKLFVQMPRPNGYNTRALNISSLAYVGRSESKVPRIHDFLGNRTDYCRFSLQTANIDPRTVVYAMSNFLALFLYRNWVLENSTAQQRKLTDY